MKEEVIVEDLDKQTFTMLDMASLLLEVTSEIVSMGFALLDIALVDKV
jgi:hypothetical protein